MESLNSEVFRSFAFYGALLVIKMLLMSFLTGFQRITKKAFVNPEDLGITGDKNLKVVTNDVDVERVRRAHLNDLENILPFFTIGWLYCHTNPGVFAANWLFKIFAYSRIAHTFVYAVYPLPQPSRAIAWIVAMVINLYMGFSVLMYFW